MTDLTDKWKKGELPSGWYYVRLIRGEYRIDLYINGKNEWIDCPDNIIDTIVCEVPSYDEWFKIKNLASLTSLLQEKNIECLHRENKLKELLKECKKMLMSSNYENMAQYKEVLELRDKINKITGENK